MSKSIDDYRNIVKILKLQLLKIRQQNISLSHQMGIISDSETSSFTPKINHYRQSDQPFAKIILIFLEFAHRCQLVGISPQMVFRIADKKRDKSVNSTNLSEVIKRIKIRMSEQQINKLVSVLAKGGKSIEYNDYLECLSAFQINSQKYPASSSRTYVQLCLLQFGQLSKQKYPQSRQLFTEISQSQNYFKYDNFINFCHQKCKKLLDTQIVAIFLGLDIQSLCRIQKDIFERQVDKIYSLIDKGLVDQKSLLFEKQRKSPVKKTNAHNDDQNDFQISTYEGDKGFNKKKPKDQENQLQDKKLQKKTKLQNKLDKKISKDILGILQTKGKSFGQFVSKLIDSEKKKTDIYYRSFSFDEVKKALSSGKEQQKKTLSNKQIMKLFRLMDLGSNGSTGTDQLIKIFLRTNQSELNDYSSYLIALFYRHLKQTQYTDPITRFTSLNYKSTDQINAKNITEVFQKLNLDQDQINFFINQVIKKGQKISQFCQRLKKQPINSTQTFTPLNKSDYKLLSDVFNKIKPKSSTKFKKYIRNNPVENQTWQTIFNSQWDCFKYCLEQCNKLTTFWRDPEFGPTKGDPHGLRSIFGNQSDKPRGIAEEQDILWLTYQQILKRKNSKSKNPKLMSKNLKSTDVVQGNLGDCWYVSALSIITSNDQYIKGKKLQNCKKSADLTYGIFPPLFHFFSKFGMYVFKFFKKYKPVYVVIDDLLPVQQSSNDLIFAKSPNEELQWVSMSQKAYAKLHHTYTNMISGDIAQGLNDLTNSLPVKQVLKKGVQKNTQRIKILSQKKQLMGCSIKIQKQKNASKSSVAQPPYEYNDRMCGLVAGHAYSIIDYIDLGVIQRKNKDGDIVSLKTELIRVRNPWGKSEWLLEWSDTPLDDDPDCQQLRQCKKFIDKHYKDKIARAINDKVQPPTAYGEAEDGQFLMDSQDWNQIFNNLFIGFNQSYQIVKNGYYRTIDFWGDKKPSGPCKVKGEQKNDTQRINFIKDNHQYVIDIKQNGTQVLMLLIQEDGRLYRGQKYPYKQIIQNSTILVFKIDGDRDSLLKYDKNLMADQTKPIVLQARRDISYWGTFDKGKYAIIPMRSEKSQKIITQFQFRLYSNKRLNISKVDQGKNVFKYIQATEEQGQKIQMDKKLIQFLEKNNPKFEDQ